MESGFMAALHKRRSIYGIAGEMPLSDAQLDGLLGEIILNMPTAFNMQGTRVVLLRGEDNQKLWRMTLDELRKVAPPAGFERTEQKIAGFAAGHGTLLYFNDTEVTERYRAENPLYEQHFPLWALQQCGMLQFAVWTALAEQGVGASLQHYNPLIDEGVRAEWGLPESWLLLAQMPFGGITAPAKEKEFLPLEERLKMFG